MIIDINLMWEIVMPESPEHPQPDDLPENERTGDEPNPSGKTPGDHPGRPGTPASR